MEAEKEKEKTVQRLTMEAEKEKEKIVQRLMAEIQEKCEFLSTIDKNSGLFIVAVNDSINLGILVGDPLKLSLKIATVVQESSVMKRVITCAVSDMAANERNKYHNKY